MAFSWNGKRSGSWPAQPPEGTPLDLGSLVGWAPPGTAHRIEADDEDREGSTLPNDRRAYVPGGIVFLTIVTYRRTPILDGPDNVARLRRALGQVMREAPFRIPAAVVLPHHAHFLWSLPRGDADYPRRGSAG